MKVATFVCTLLVFTLLAAPHANAAPHAKRRVRIRTATIHRTQPIRRPMRTINSEGGIPRANAIIAELKEKFPGFAERLIRDPRFAFDIRAVVGTVRVVGYPPEWYEGYQGNYAMSNFAIKQCESVLQANQEQFDRIESQFVSAKNSVKRESVIAILDNEAMCGAGPLGTHPIFGALYAHAAFNRRAKRRKWAHDELIAFMRLAQRYENAPGAAWNPNLGIVGWSDPFTIKGSWAGAFGLNQDLPSAYERTAMRDDGARCVSQIESGVPPNPFDLRDAHCSIASYLLKTGRTGYMSFLRYNPSRSYARSCVKAARRFRTDMLVARTKAAR
ncbi:MAG TPA: lytic murein transglycosylase [Candidatus Paceibacterota bacterium]|nr:lytic murein transglycosylase [Candidatus Paceibacterota bacterium]